MHDGSNVRWRRKRSQTSTIVEGEETSSKDTVGIIKGLSISDGVPRFHLSHRRCQLDLVWLMFKTSKGIMIPVSCIRIK